jgi:hypothetical protein
MAEINTGTGAGLREFLDRAASRGDLNSSTAHGLKAVATKVLEIEEDPDGVDIRSLDVENLLERFAILQRAQYTPGSMRTYQSRFRNAVTMYIAWLDNDPNWRKVVKSRQPSERSGKAGKPTLPEQDQATPNPVRVADADTSIARDSDIPPMVNYRLPLRPDLIIELTLPVDLTASDAARVASFVKSLSFDNFQTSAPDRAGKEAD